MGFAAMGNRRTIDTIDFIFSSRSLRFELCRSGEGGERLLVVNVDGSGVATVGTASGCATSTSSTTSLATTSVTSVSATSSATGSTTAGALESSVNLKEDLFFLLGTGLGGGFALQNKISASKTEIMSSISPCRRSRHPPPPFRVGRHPSRCWHQHLRWPDGCSPIWGWPRFPSSEQGIARR